MEQKTKFLIIGLAGLALILGASVFYVLTAKGSLEKEKEALAQENASLNKQVQEGMSRVRRLEEEKNYIGRELDNIKRESQDLQSKYQRVEKEKQDLAQKIQALSQPPKAQPQAAGQAALQRPRASTAGEDEYWAGILKEKTDLEFQLSKVRDELKAIQIANEELQRQKAAFELDVNNLNREKEDLKRKFDYNQTLMDSIAQELVRERNDKSKIEDSFKTVKNENDALRRQLKGLNSKKISLETKLNEIRQEKDALAKKMGQMEAMLTDKISMVGALKDQLDAISEAGKDTDDGAVTLIEKKESVELPPIIVKSGDSEMVKPEGKVLSVTEDGKVIIVDIGQDAGVAVADTLEVYRAGKNIASVKVVSLRRTVAACEVERKSAEIRIGDSVK